MRYSRSDGTFTIDQVLNFRVVSQGDLPNSWLTIHVHLVVDSDGNVISGTNDFSFGCHGSFHTTRSSCGG